MDSRPAERRICKHCLARTARLGSLAQKAGHGLPTSAIEMCSCATVLLQCISLTVCFYTPPLQSSWLYQTEVDELM